MADKLTPRQRAFIDHYFACGMNASLAARRAGYKKRQSAAENMSNPVIRDEIERIYRENTMPADEILARLSDQGRADIRDITNADGLLDMRKARRLGKTGLIKRIKQTTITSDSSETHIIEVELHDVQKALQLLGKYRALFTEKVEHSGTIQYIDMTSVEAEIIRRIEAGELTRADVGEITGDESLAEQLFRRAKERAQTGVSTGKQEP